MEMILITVLNTDVVLSTAVSKSFCTAMHSGRMEMKTEVGGQLD